MKKKKIVSFVLFFTIVLALISCSGTPLSGGNPTAEGATPVVITTPVVEQLTNPSHPGTTTSFANNLITISGFPEESFPVRWGGGIVQNNECGDGAPESCYILADDGVLSYDHQTEENKDNLSAIWSGGANVDNLMENRTGTYTCPEGGYVKVTYPQAMIVMEQLELSVEVEAAAETNYTLLVRCLYAENGASTDRNTVMDFFTEHPGRVKVMRYPVDPDWSGFFSFVHLEEDLANGHGQLHANADNCGNSGCDDSYVILVDTNHKTITIYHHTVADGWELVYTNAIMP